MTDEYEDEYNEEISQEVLDLDELEYLQTIPIEDWSEEQREIYSEQFKDEIAVASHINATASFIENVKDNPELEKELSNEGFSATHIIAERLQLNRALAEQEDDDNPPMNQRMED